MDLSERYGSGTFDSYEDAVTKCKQILDEFLESAVTSNDTSDSLYMTWVMYGENPLIDGGYGGHFSTKAYVTLRCRELTSNSA